MFSRHPAEYQQGEAHGTSLVSCMFFLQNITITLSLCWLCVICRLFFYLVAVHCLQYSVATMQLQELNEKQSATKPLAADFKLGMLALGR